MHTIIVGNGNTGITAATHLRRWDEESDITLIEKSDTLAAASGGLSYLLNGKVKNADELIGATADEMKTIFNIDVRLGTSVAVVDDRHKTLLISGGKKLYYDKLMIMPQMLQTKIATESGAPVFELRSPDEAQKIIVALRKKHNQNVVILGSEEKALATAEALMNSGAKVSLISSASIIPTWLDADMAFFLKRRIEAAGVNIITGVEICRFEVNHVVLNNGQRIDYNMAIIVPPRPDTADIRQAKAEADVIAGKLLQTDFNLSNHFVKVFDYAVGQTGCNENELRQHSQNFNRLYLATGDGENFMPDSAKLRMKLLFASNGTILGIQIAGRRGVFARLNTMAALIFKGGSVQDLAALPVAYFPEFSRAKDALNILGSLASEICHGELKTAGLAQIADGDILLDVRSKKHFYPAADKTNINIPLATLRKNLKHLPQGKNIFIRGNGSYDAYLAYRILTQRGFDKLFMINEPETEN